MRRGLMQWDPEELPRAVLDARLNRLRTAMRREKLDAFLIYTNIVRPSAVCWLTGFTPYWSEAALLVLRDGAPIFCTALSKRVAEWIKSTNVVSEVTNAPRPGKLLGERLAADASIKRLGVLELDALPTGLYDDLTEAAPALTLVDASAPFAGIRAGIDDAERHLLARADALAIAALDQIDPANAADAGAIAGQVEEHARLAGAEESYIAVAADLDTDRRLLRIVKPAPLGQRFAVRASIAYKGVWVRRIRTFPGDDAGRRAVARAEAWFAEACAALDPAKSLASQLDARMAALPGAALENWIAEGCVGSYPLQVVAASGGPATQPAGSAMILTLSLTIDGVPWLGAAPLTAGQTRRN
jgi:Creatinase/Prolidase N-terminal domain